MRVVLHDYAGHPFQSQLSRELAARGHEVDHVSCASYVSGKGRLARRAGDPDSLTYTALPLKSEFAKYSPVKRLWQEVSYAKLFLQHLRRGERPEVLIMCNVPLVAHWLIFLATKRTPTVFWHQDVYSRAWSSELRRRFGRVGAVPAAGLVRMERAIARRAHRVVVIADTFLPVHRGWGTKPERLSVQPNWAPLDDLFPVPQADNAWAARHGFTDHPVVLYSGTLGLKHDTSVFRELSAALRRQVPDAVVVVVSQGEAAQSLHCPAEGRVVLPFQPFEELSRMLGAADLLLTVLEPEASDYSVPSKTLSYLCAGRPVVALLPRSNPAFSIVERAQGLPFDLAETSIEAIAGSMAGLLADAPERSRRGAAARAYAEDHFDVGLIADRFEALLLATVDGYPTLVDTALQPTTVA